MSRYVLVSGIREGDTFAHHFDGRRDVCIAARDAQINVEGWPPHLVKVWGTYGVAGGRTLETWWGVDHHSHVELIETAREKRADELAVELAVVTQERDAALARIEELEATPAEVEQERAA